MRLLVRRDGTAVTVHDDAVMGHAKALGRVEIARAGFVEPDEAGEWMVDLRPSGGGELGPFARREDALRAESRALENLLYERG